MEVYNEFEDSIKWSEESIEEFKLKNDYGFIEPALLGIITGLIGEILLLIISLHI